MSKEFEDLAKRASAGDVPALESLLAKHLPQLEAFVRLKGGEAFRPRESTSDVVQSICREVLQGKERFEWHDIERFRAWLYVTAQRKIADRFEYHAAAKRDQKREQRAGIDGSRDSWQPLLDFYQTALTPSRHAMGLEEMERLETAIRSLPAHYQEVIVLTRLMGLSSEEAAKQMGKTSGATRTLLSRALAELSARLDGGGEESP